MKHIHIVQPYNSAAMQRMTKPLMDLLPNIYEITTSEQVDIEADLNFHMPFHTMIGLEEKGEGKHVVAYTHVNVGQEAYVIDACERADAVTAMTFRGREELIALGVDPEKIWVNYCGADEFSYRKRLIGIIGYPQPNGRKREGLLLDLAWNYDLTPYEFILTGEGWQGMAERLHELGVSCSWHHADTFEKLVTTMRFLDVLLVTGYREGSPLPLLECMRAGVPVLSPNFGYAADLLDDEYIYSDTDDLMDKLNGMFEQSFRHHNLVKSWAWADYAAEYAMLFGRLLNDNVELFVNQGRARYTQLLDIISEVKPNSICEIGTWNGNNAIRMIQEAQKYKDVSYVGFDLFEFQTPLQYRRELSKIGQDMSIVNRRLMATGADIELIQGDTNETLYPSLIEGEGEIIDFYFIDGGHSEKTIGNDGSIVLSAMLANDNAVAVFDDYYHKNKPEGMGCNKFIDELDKSEFEVTHLPHRTQAEDGREVGMVKVTRKNAAISVQMSNESFAYAQSSN